jgi:endonuclease III
MRNDRHLDEPAVLDAVQMLKRHYYGFPWESEVWIRDGGRRSPYRVLILFGLSPRTKDRLLVEVCRSFFRRFPNPQALLPGWPVHRTDFEAMVRIGQLPFVESVVDTLRQNRGVVPEDRERLLQIRGVGEKVAECVVGYGWGQEALPMDGNGCRVIERLVGQVPDTRPWSAAYVRQRLMALYEDHREWMTSHGMAMIDLHELLRLHGQVLCRQRPQCSRCPVSVCMSRRQAYLGSDTPGIDGALWQEWRELLLDGPEPAVKEEH